MEIWAVKFTAAELSRIHPDHLGFLIASSHCCNELTGVMPYIIFEQNITQCNNAERAFVDIRFYTLVRLQISRIFEYRELCNQYVSKIRKTYPATAERIGRKTSEISRKINHANWARTLRNKVASHFDAEYALGALSNLPKDQPLSFVTGHYEGTVAYSFADQILVRALLMEAGDGDADNGHETILNWTLNLSALIRRFHAEILLELFKMNGLHQNREKLEIRKNYCRKKGETFIPIATLAPAE